MLKKYLIAAVGAILIFSLAHPTKAANYTYSRKSVLVTGSGQSVSLFDGRFTGGATIAVADVNGDGVDEMITAAGPGGGPVVQVIDAAGKTINQWLAYDENFKGGVNVAAGDIDGDGQAEIITAPQGDLAPLVRIYRGSNLVNEFLAFPSSYHEGLSLAVLPTSKFAAGKIIVGTQGLRHNEIRIFTNAGKLQHKWLTKVARDTETGVSVAAGWSDAWEEPVIITGAGFTAAPRVMVYGLWSEKVLTSWLAFNTDMRAGLNVDYRDGVIAVAPKGLGQPQVKTFDAAGKYIKDYRFFEDKFRGGLNVALLSTSSGMTVAAVPTAVKKNQAAIGTKKVVVDLSDQQLKLYEGNKVVSTRRISSGKWNTPTPIGTFKTRNKISVAYSKPYKLYMEWWMAFTADGKYGLHSLPYWATKNGKLYEGAAHIGTPVSHGCIRQTVAEAKSLYDWAPVGTPVIVQK